MWVTVARKVAINDGRLKSETVPWNQPIKPEVRWKSEKKASDADVIRNIPDDIKRSLRCQWKPALDLTGWLLSCPNSPWRTVLT